ncbi:hypothetical protein MMC25_003509 [Agyrium rufum]|nr:hypothetical protein [Agyrium rufum]
MSVPNPPPSPSPLKVALLIVSDTAFRDPTQDRVLPVLTETILSSSSSSSSPSSSTPTWTIAAQSIVPDDIGLIRHQVEEWCFLGGPKQMNLVLTSGGTGFAVRDVTPEAVGPLIERVAGGLV